MEEQEHTASRTFYDLVGISAEGSPDEVRAAYRRLALKYHPENTSRFIEVQEAYETLSDLSRHASYDRALARGVCRLAFSGRRSQSHHAYYHHHHQQTSLTLKSVRILIEATGGVCRLQILDLYLRGLISSSGMYDLAPISTSSVI
ncbi:unnamed protein product [Miscanthus lutarioriparius]|uniref:J domain-containing protein n=1 Tax=Miscanthus lutarioriparius TaxID=422564 RepID=A0A811NI69_9POAL|nr:unnamed protein product [Miscanthus lutarioriparius]